MVRLVSLGDGQNFFVLIDASGVLLAGEGSELLAEELDFLALSCKADRGGGLVEAEGFL